MRFLKSFELLLKNRLVVYLFIPLLFVLVWVYVTLILIFQTSITVLNYEYPKVVIQSKDLTKGVKINSSFVAKDNDLGTVGVRFNTQFRVNNDQLVFRIKRGGEQNWFYEYHYNTDQFQPEEYFPFGFSIQPDSKGQLYEFEIESLNGSEENAVRISDQMPQILTQHQYSKSAITSSTGSIILFGFNKIFNLLHSFQFILQSFLSLIPLLIYLVWIFKPKWFNTYSKTKVLSLRGIILRYPLLSAFIVFLYVVIFFLKADLSILFLIILGVGTFISKVYKLGGKGIFIQALLMLVICPVLVVFQFTKAGETAALFAFCFMFGGTVYSFFEIK